MFVLPTFKKIHEVGVLFRNRGQILSFFVLDFKIDHENVPLFLFLSLSDIYKSDYSMIIP